MVRVAALRNALRPERGESVHGDGSAFAGRRRQASALAVIGDTPYGDEQVKAFPRLVADINADRQVGTVLHLGDVKTGGSTCTDQRLRAVRGLYDSFADPFVYTPGDNEWTDCHRPTAGGYLPTERLASVRDVFFSESGETLGRRSFRPIRQADEAGFEDFVENQLWGRSQTVSSTVHVVGSNNGLAPWFGAAETEEQGALRLQEFEERMDANLEWLDRTFAEAQRRDARGVMIAMQADMFGSGPVDGFTPIVQRIADLASGFDGPVLLLEGDSHRYLVDRPLSAGSAAHGVSTAAPNVTRIVVEGETASEWLKLRVDPRGARLFRWTRERV